MLKNNLPYLALFQFALVLIHTSGITAPASHMLMLLPAVLLFNTIPYYAARNLISTDLIATPEKRRIIRPTVIYAAVGSLLFSLVLMADWILDDDFITDAYRWIFALYNLLVGIPVWRATSRSLAYMDGFYQEYSTYRILRPLIRAIPAGILAFGLIGTLGYLNLAWIIAKHLLIFILYALIWVAITAILKDSARAPNATRCAPGAASSGRRTSSTPCTPSSPTAACSSSSACCKAPTAGTNTPRSSRKR